MLRCCALLSVSLLPLSAPAQSDQPVLTGVITSTSPRPLAISGYQLDLAPGSVIRLRDKDHVDTAVSPSTAFLGEQAEVYGTRDRKFGLLHARRVILTQLQPASIAGNAVIDAAPIPSNPTAPRLLRTDGFLLVISPETRLTFDPPLTAASPLTTNLWISYHGTQGVDGKVTVDQAHITPNLVTGGEGQLRTKAEYDPASVSPEAHQSGTSKFFLGTKVDQIPPWPDPAMQARVERIGRSLIPAYQRDLPATDATRINFRFQVISFKHRDAAIALPNGIIVVSPEILDRLPSDDELAAVLADGIACALEKQTFRAQPPAHKLTATEIAGAAGSIAVPGLGLATELAGGGVAKHLQTLREQQSARVSLGLLHDAGYDLTAAPLAWWRLAPSKPRPLTEVNLPVRSATLYTALGTTWRATLAPTAPLPAPAIAPASTP